MERAAELFERAAEIKSDDYQAPAVVIPVYRALGREKEIKGSARKTLERAENELKQHPENTRPAYLGAMCLIELGEPERAREWLSRAMAIDPDDQLTQYNVACGYCRLGDRDAAFELLEKSLLNASDWIKAWIRFDSDLDPLRGLPRYQKLRELIEQAGPRRL